MVIFIPMAPRLITACIVSLVVLSSLGAQRVIKPKLVEIDWKGIIYKKEWSIDLRVHEDGAAIAYNVGEIKSYNKTKFYHLELGYIRDSREKTQTKFSSLGRSGSYAFGKINSLINLRGGFGTKKYLSEKEKRNGLAVGYVYEIGPSLALLKPYKLDLIYVEVIDNQQVPTIRSESFSADNADKFLDEGSISSRSSFFSGFDELKVRAGLQAKLGLHLGLGAFDEYVKAFETGIMVDAFPSKIPIVVETEEVSNSRFFFKLYLNFQFGRRSN
jgi:hypothetical protein